MPYRPHLRARHLAPGPALALALSCGAAPPRAEVTTRLADARLAAPEGARAYNLHCASCHGERGEAPGQSALFTDPTLGERFATGLELLEFLEARMPPGARRESLTRADYLAVTEYLLRARGVSVGSRLDRAGASRVRLQPAGSRAQ